MTLSKTEGITIGIGAVILLALFVCIAALFTSHSYEKEQSQDFKEKIASKDSLIQRIQLEREALLIKIANSDKVEKAAKADAETALNKVKANKQFYQDNRSKYESIPADVRAMSDDSLQSAIERYYNH